MSITTPGFAMRAAPDLEGNKHVQYEAVMRGYNGASMSLQYGRLHRNEEQGTTLHQCLDRRTTTLFPHLHGHKAGY
jgi:hypothetical protein